jgi:glutaconate CoA-transferase subunit B
MGYHEQTKRMEVLSLHPGITMEQVQANTGFAIEASGTLTQTEAPTANELRILREEVDPLRYIIGRG